MESADLKEIFWPYRNIIFDAGGVIIRWDPESVAKQFASDIVSAEALAAASYNHPDWSDFDTGRCTEKALCARMANRTNLTELFCKEYVTAIKESLSLIPETVSLIHDLAALGKQLFLLSNLPRESHEYLCERDTLWGLFRGSVFSYEIGFAKPSPEAFKRFMSKFTLDLSESIYIDDRQENVESAQKQGMIALQFSNVENLLSKLAAENAPRLKR